MMRIAQLELEPDNRLDRDLVDSALALLLEVMHTFALLRAGRLIVPYLVPLLNSQIVKPSVPQQDKQGGYTPFPSRGWLSQDGQIGYVCDQNLASRFERRYQMYIHTVTTVTKAFT